QILAPGGEAVGVAAIEPDGDGGEGEDAENDPGKAGAAGPVDGGLGNARGAIQGDAEKFEEEGVHSVSSGGDGGFQILQEVVENETLWVVGRCRHGLEARVTGDVSGGS